MFFKSIRWRMQIWYGVLLLVVLVGFGVTAYQLERGRQFRRIDDDLQRRVSVFMGTLRGRGPDGRGPNFGGPEGRGPAGRPPDRLPAQDGPPPNRPFAGGPLERFPRQPGEFRLPPLQANLFGGDEVNSYYFVLWSREDQELARSTNAPADISRPPRAESSPPAPPRMRGSFRELIHVTPPGELILVGRSVAPELSELRRVAWSLAGVGGVILLLGFAGGWWLVTRAIRPIEDISATAVKIAAGDLSQRISVADTDNELGRLTGVLNSTFARLEAAFAQQGRFTADAAHELRTPVSVMLTQTQTALNRERSAADYRETVEACQRAAQRMRRLTESLLELARLDAGQDPIKRRRFDLADTARDCLEHVLPLADERGIKLQSTLPTVECVGDAARLSQVITNLLINAIQYNRENGEVRLIVQLQKDFAVIAVADTGHGISADDLPHVFERFFRADKSRSGVSGHTGLGLAISKAIVEAHGGALEVSSQMGVGTTFTARLPTEIVGSEA